MSLYYFDASALVKYYIREPGSVWIKGLIDALATDGVDRLNTAFISEASITESAAAFAILHRTQRISKRVQDGAFRLLMKDIANGLLSTIPIITADFQLAAHLTQRHPLKAYDAIQLAVALRHNRAMAAYRLSVTFIGSDKALLDAVRAEGLAADDPFNHTMPQDTHAAP